MTPRKPSSLGHCPITATLNVIGGKRKGQIWWRLSSGIRRFGELQRSIPEITPKMLTQQLRELERDGVVSRIVYPEVPPKVEYCLTEYGKTLAPVFASMSEWGGSHLQRSRQPRLSHPRQRNPRRHC